MAIIESTRVIVVIIPVSISVVSLIVRVQVILGAEDLLTVGWTVVRVCTVSCLIRMGKSSAVSPEYRNQGRCWFLTFCYCYYCPY